MAPPILTIDQVCRLIPQASDVQVLDRGGQKIVFTGIINNEKYALKFMSPNPQDTGPNSEQIDDVTARARREVETMQQCSTPHLVNMGPIGLTSDEIDGNPIIYFTEEFIEGKNLIQYLREMGLFSVAELQRLALHISEEWQSAIQEFIGISGIGETV